MPWMQKILGRLNHAFSHENISSLVEQRELFAPGGDWVANLSGLPEGDVPSGLTSYLAALPAGLREVLRALIYEDLGRGGNALPVTFAWAPAYDFELQVWECPGTAGSLGGITVMVRSRYPGDAIPTSS